MFASKTGRFSSYNGSSVSEMVSFVPNTDQNPSLGGILFVFVLTLCNDYLEKKLFFFVVTEFYFRYQPFPYIDKNVNNYAKTLRLPFKV